MFLIRLKTFLKSLFWHIYSGSPKSSKEEINYRYQICIRCDQFDKIKSQCNLCGCLIKNKKVFLNKLAWADQECPIGKWKQITRK
jgi:hypothetical protein